MNLVFGVMAASTCLVAVLLYDCVGGTTSEVGIVPPRAERVRIVGSKQHARG